MQLVPGVDGTGIVLCLAGLGLLGLALHRGTIAAWLAAWAGVGLWVVKATQLHLYLGAELARAGEFRVGPLAEPVVAKALVETAIGAGCALLLLAASRRAGRSDRQVIRVAALLLIGNGLGGAFDLLGSGMPLASGGRQAMAACEESVELGAASAGLALVIVALGHAAGHSRRVWTNSRKSRLLTENGPLLVFERGEFRSN